MSGYRSLLAFWIGGACAPSGVPPIPPTVPPLTGGILIDKGSVMEKEYRDRQKMLEYDEEELLEIIGMSAHIL